MKFFKVPQVSGRSALDQPIMIALFLLLGIGLVQVYSASYIYAIETHADALFYFRKQIIFAGLSIALFFVTANIPWRWIEKYSEYIWYVIIALLILTFVPHLGVKVNGASRWIQFPGFRLQPSELLKVFLPIIFAKFFILPSETEVSPRRRIWQIAALAIPILILLKQPDFGSFVVCCFILFSILFVFGLKWRYVFAGAATAALSFMTLIWFAPYRRARLLSFLDPWADASGKGFQVIQSMTSFYSGGITGVGLGQGQGKLFFLPEAHTDFTLAVLGEETGFLGVAFVLAVFGYLIFRGMQIAIQTKHKFAQCIVIGLIANFSIQICINVGMTMGLMPTKGITLPFLSYGGSSLFATAILFGLLLNIHRHRAYFEQRYGARQ